MYVKKLNRLPYCVSSNFGVCLNNFLFEIPKDTFTQVAVCLMEEKWKDVIYQLFIVFLLKKSMAFKFTILNSVHLIMFCAMFGLNWICGTEEVKYVKKVYRQADGHQNVIRID